MPSPVDVFVWYANEDEELRIELTKHLGSLKRQNLIHEYDHRVLAGDEREQVVAQRIASSHVILLLISASFFAAPHYYDDEMQRALERQRQNKARVIPILLRPLDLSGEPIAKLQSLPKNGKPVERWDSINEAMKEVALGVREAVEEIWGVQADAAGSPVSQHPTKAPEGTAASKSEAAHAWVDQVSWRSFDSLPETRLSFQPWPSLAKPLCFNSLPKTRLHLSYWMRNEP